MLDGTTGTHAQLAVGGLFATAESISFEAWVRWTPSGATAGQRIFDFSSDSGFHKSLTADASGKGMWFNTNEDSLSGYVTTAKLATNVWVHVVASTEEATKKNRIYVNGALVAEHLYAGPANDSPIATLNYLGRPADGISPYFQGEISEFRLYGTALTDAQVATNYLAGPDDAAIGAAMPCKAWSCQPSSGLCAAQSAADGTSCASGCSTGACASGQCVGLTATPQTVYEAGDNGSFTVQGHIQAIATGPHHSLALLTDGTVVAWGLNDKGQTDVPEGLTGVIQIAAGGHHSVAMRADGSLVAWGANDVGQCDLAADMSNLLLAVANNYSLVIASASFHLVGALPAATMQNGLESAVAIAAGNGIVALRLDGTLMNIGTSAIPANLVEVRALAASGQHVVGLQTNGLIRSTVWATPDQPWLQDIEAIAADDSYFLALRRNGRLGYTAAPDGPWSAPGIYTVAIAASGGHRVVQTATPCDDGDPCTVLDRCQVGVCTGRRALPSATLQCLDARISDLETAFNGVHDSCVPDSGCGTQWLECLTARVGNLEIGFNGVATPSGVADPALRLLGLQHRLAVLEVAFNGLPTATCW